MTQLCVQGFERQHIRQFDMCTHQLASYTHMLHALRAYQSYNARRWEKGEDGGTTSRKGSLKGGGGKHRKAIDSSGGV
jgi:hypothetical protein